jgi:hypothetical protein
MLGGVGSNDVELNGRAHRHPHASDAAAAQTRRDPANPGAGRSRKTRLGAAPEPVDAQTVGQTDQELDSSAAGSCISMLEGRTRPGEAEVAERPKSTGKSDTIKDKVPEDQPTLTALGRTLALVAKAVGVPDSDENSSAEERRRLKEKLKTAIESGTRHSVRHIESERESWTEYIFGICKPDGRVGKAGSRHFPFSAHLTARRLMCMQW